MNDCRMLTADELTMLAERVEQWCREAGECQLGYFRDRRLQIDRKLNDADVVTAADRESERIIIEHIRRAFPEHSILSEESGEHLTASGYRWVIDPLDGTTNFSSGLPLFAVSVALEYEGEAQLGVVYLPRQDEMFEAVKGAGARLNGQAIHSSDNTKLSRAVVSTGFPVDKATNPDNNLDNVGRVLPEVRGMRRLGAAAVDICYVAAGFLDGFWELNLHRWDVSAAMLIAAEAGARMKFFRQGRGISPLVASAGVFAELESLIK